MTNFKPVNPKTTDVGQLTNRIVQTLRAASPTQWERGSHWYDQGHREATQVGLGLNPTPETHLPQGEPVKFAPPPGLVDRINAKGAAEIATLSPSMPAGMTWDYNPAAAHELRNLSPTDAAVIAKGGQPARQLLKSRPDLGNLRHAGSGAITKALSIEHGADPEASFGRNVNHVKTYSFYRNLHAPGRTDAVTIDGRAHDIAVGQEMGFDAPRGLGAKGRYDLFQAAYRKAAEVMHAPSPDAAQAVAWLADKESGRSGAGSGRRSDRIPFGQIG